MNARLQEILGEIAARRQRQRFHGALAMAWLIGCLFAVAMWKAGVSATMIVAVLSGILLVASVAIFLWSRRGFEDPHRLAKDIETRHPELQTALLAAIDQTPDPSSGELSYLQSRVVFDTIASAEREEWIELVPRPRLTALRALNVVGILALLFTAGLLLKPTPVAPSAVPMAEKPTPVGLDITVDPGDVEIERGTPLTVQVRFGQNQPVDANLEITTESGEVRSLPLVRPFTDPVYQAKLDSVAGPLRYRVVTPAGASESYNVRVFDLPALRSSVAVLHFPDHLAKEPETLKDPRVIQAVERTRLEFSLAANLPGLTVTMVAKDKPPLKPTVDAADPATHRLSLELLQSARYEIILTDSAGRRNARKDLVDIKVLPNKAPVVQVVLPQKNEKATPIQEVRLEARVTDDSGLLAHGLRYTLDGEKWEEITTPSNAADKRPLLSHIVDLEAAGAAPKDVIMWNAWAEDLGPGGKKRRVNGDIHLVRVRDFDEEFYQQAAPPGGAPAEAGAGQQGAELIKTQTQILNATWGLRRDHAEISNTPPPADELETLRRSQEIAMETAAAMEEEQPDPTVRQFLTDARLAMKDALSELTGARDTTSAAPLDPAIAHEQAALRHLYQLMSSKTMIMTGGQSQSQSESASESMPNEDLDLKAMENPYQAEKEAKPETPAGAAAEAMDILKRLEELAKRQRDLNEELQALQMALNEADTPEKKAEIERQLKQLREQQRDLLSDVDQLREKTSDPERAAAEPRQNEALEEAREKAQQANEQLGENKLGEALAAGRRAQESLEKLQDDFRENSAAKLGEQLRELRQDARALQERQEALNENPGETQPSENRLSDAADANPELTKQRADLQKLLDDMRATAESAEQAEPLVAQDLAEALRDANQTGVARALEQMRTPGEGPAAERATAGIADLTREIEGAAERILGNEAQALRYARDELQRLANEVAAEAAKSGKPGDGESQTPGKPGEQPGESSQTAGEPGESGKPGEGSGKAPPNDEAGQASAESSPGNQPGEQPGQGQGQGQQAGEGQGGGQAEGPATAGGPRPTPARGTGGGGTGTAPITGGGYEAWSDRLYDLESVTEDPEAQSAVARARRASREMRRDFNRHSKEPDAAALQNEIIRPLAEAAKELDARLKELDRENPLAPVGRDPVPERYSEIVRRYFEELGK